MFVDVCPSPDVLRISTKAIFSDDCTKFLVKTKVYNFILTIAMCPSHPISEHQLEAGRGLAGSAPHVLSEDSVASSLRWTLIQQIIDIHSYSRYTEKMQ